MTRQHIIDQIFAKRSYLCIGLDTDISKVPAHLLSFADPVFEFNKQIIDATKGLCVSYKINTAFYEAAGAKGWASLEKTVRYIPDEHFKIVDAKRGDIGNTSSQYAKAFFETLPFDAITVAPYMGEDSIRPFLEYPGKWTILLGLTSNPGSKDFEQLKVHNDNSPSIYLYEKVLLQACKWGNENNLMFVTGATKAGILKDIRTIIPEHFLLVPGIGAQGGSLAEVTNNGAINECGLLVNASRAVIYAGNDTSFAEKAHAAAKQYQQEMDSYLAKSPS